MRRLIIAGITFVVPTLRILATAIACVPCILRAQTDEGTAKPIVRSLLLDPAAITLTDRFTAPTAPPTLELAIRFIGDQIEQRRKADAAEPAMDRLWKASFLGFIPIKPGGHPGTMNSPVVKDDDPFFTPAYLTVVSRQLDREVAASDKRAKFLFGH
jgi:hypothetical protein